MFERLGLGGAPPSACTRTAVEGAGVAGHDTDDIAKSLLGVRQCTVLLPFPGEDAVEVDVKGSMGLLSLRSLRFPRSSFVPTPDALAATTERGRALPASGFTPSTARRHLLQNITHNTTPIIVHPRGQSSVWRTSRPGCSNLRTAPCVISSES